MPPQPAAICSSYPAAWGGQPAGFHLLSAHGCNCFLSCRSGPAPTTIPPEPTSLGKAASRPSMRMRLISTNCRATSAAGAAGSGNRQVPGAAGQGGSSATAPAIECAGGGPAPAAGRQNAAATTRPKQRTLAAARHDGRRQHHHCAPAAGSRVVSDPLQGMGQREGRLERGGAVRRRVSGRRVGGPGGAQLHRDRSWASSRRARGLPGALQREPNSRPAPKLCLRPHTCCCKHPSPIGGQLQPSSAATSCAARLELKAGGRL